MTTAKESIEKAASLLTNRSAGLIRTYGSVGAEAVEIAKGWADLARAIAYVESRPNPTEGTPTETRDTK